MYVCVCHGVTDRAIREAVDDGATSLYDVQCTLAVASCCGRCEDSARQVVDEHIEKRVASARPFAASG